MRTHRTRLLASALGLLAVAGAPVAAASFPARIDLPDGWRPEGVTAGRGTTAYAGSLADGAIAQVDLRTGSVDVLVPGAPGQLAVGLDYEAAADRLWVAGGPTGAVRAYDASTGRLLASYAVAAGFLNDVAVTSDAVYVTDSFVQQLIVIPLGGGRELPAPGDAYSLPITGDFAYGPGFNANGIVESGGALLVPNSSTGQLFAIDPATGHSTEILPAGSVPAADGLELRGSTLWVVQNQLNLVRVYGIRGTSLTLLGTVSSPDLDVPTTLAFAGGQLWAVNARFSTPPVPTTEYWITRLPTR
jgi:streptogramin lyase